MEVVPYVTIARPYLHLIPVCTGSKLIIVVNFILSVQPYLTLISRSYHVVSFWMSSLSNINQISHDLDHGKKDDYLHVSYYTVDYTVP
jgi:hypothetical protein